MSFESSLRCIPIPLSICERRDTKKRELEMGHVRGGLSARHTRNKKDVVFREVAKKKEIERNTLMHNFASKTSPTQEQKQHISLCSGWWLLFFFIHTHIFMDAHMHTNFPCFQSKCSVLFFSAWVCVAGC